MFFEIGAWLPLPCSTAFKKRKEPEIYSYRTHGCPDSNLSVDVALNINEPGDHFITRIMKYFLAARPQWCKAAGKFRATALSAKAAGQI